MSMGEQQHGQHGQNGQNGSARENGHGGASNGEPALPVAANGTDSPYFMAAAARPRALRDALRAVAGTDESSATQSETPSEEDYDEMTRPPVAVVVRRKRDDSLGQPKVSKASKAPKAIRKDGGALVFAEKLGAEGLSPKSTLELPGIKDARSYILSADDAELREILRRGLQREKEPEKGKKKSKFSDHVFTRNFSTFDRQNAAAANSPFHGFFTLFWIFVFLFIVKIAAENWRSTGSPLGTNEIMTNMFHRDVLVLLLSDGFMCALTAVSWVLQRLVYRGYIDWDRSGWVIQNIWQTIFIAGVVGWTLLRDWPWSHTVFFVLHGLTMLMKQHSYAFYNGYLSSVYKQRKDLLAKLKQLERMAPVRSPSLTEPQASAISTSHLAHPPSAYEMKERRMSASVQGAGGGAGAGAGGEGLGDLERIAAAIQSGRPLDMEQIHVFERIIKWEIDGLTDELKGKATKPEKAYPHNLTLANQYEYNLLPTLVYELEYPRSDSINWYYVAEKGAACFGVIFVMIMISQAFIYPVVMKTLEMKDAGMPLAERFKEFPWILSDLIFPLMMEYLLSWYLIWETILNFLAELTCFADRSFYDAWWNSVTWDQFARDWNRPVHVFLLRHVYHSSISAMKVDRYTATLITFFLSACVHELVMWCIFKKLRGYLLFLQMCQLPLVKLSRTKWLRNKQTLGNAMFWMGIFMGPSILCSLYLIL